jgi:hypothetical protein
MWAAEIKLKGMDCPTQQSFYCKTILDFVERRVCSVVYSFEVCSRSELPASLAGYLRGNAGISLLCFAKTPTAFGNQ